MGQRTNLQLLLEQLLGSKNVYYQPPESVKMQYPAIIYSLDEVNTDFANNNPYNHSKRYSVTLIDKNPDSIILDKLLSLPRCSFNRRYNSDNLNHSILNLYY